MHMDAFRLNSPAEMIQIGFEDYIDGSGICFVEWADRIDPIMPKDSIRVRFKVINDDNREIILET